MIRPLFRLPLVFQMLLGLVLGLGVGLLWPDFGASLRPIGTAFVEAVKMIVIPVVFAAVTLGLYRMGSELKVLGRVAAISLGYFYLATVISILIGLLLNAAFHPGAGAPLAATGKVPQNLAVSVDWIKFFMDMIPSNIVAAMAEQKILPTLVFAILFGLALASVGKVGEPMVAVLEAVMAAMFKITKWITSLAPIAIFAVMAWLFATQGLATVIALAKLVGVMYLGLAIMVAIFWLMLLAIGEKPLAVTKAVMEPMILAFSTRSSEVTLPLHMEKLRAMGASERIVSVVLPLGYAFKPRRRHHVFCPRRHLPRGSLWRDVDLVDAVHHRHGHDDREQGQRQRPLRRARRHRHGAVGDRAADRGARGHRRRRRLPRHGPHRDQRVRQHGRGEVGREVCRRHGRR
ncbi:DAACS family dicarboxylate/amino acid:cation (Na+ or H+) symporter [Bradyrhizobium diazoefficiens]